MVHSSWLMVHSSWLVGNSKHATTNNQPPTPKNQHPPTALRENQSPGSGNPTFGREAHRGESSRLQTQAPLHHQPPNGRTSRLGRENATCSTWGDPKTAVAPLPRAPQHPPTNNQLPTTNYQPK
ncbi:MAG: hypothetical protein ACHBN1_24415 [Heteroscytonema crispum UTEX LB 1556]